MSLHDDTEFLKTYKEMSTILSTTIKIGHTQILNIVVSDLILKYRSCIRCGDDRYIESFATVLRYYLTEDELQEAMELPT